MSQALIGQGPGNPAGDSEIKQFKCNGAVAKGDVLSLYGATGYVVDQASAALVPIGVAAEVGADGDWINVVTRGFCNYVTNEDTNMAIGDLLFAAAGGTAKKVTYGSDLGIQQGGILGMTLQAETGTTCTAVLLFPGAA
jgi:hypothetical protein